MRKILGWLLFCKLFILFTEILLKSRVCLHYLKNKITYKKAGHILLITPPITTKRAVCEHAVRAQHMFSQLRHANLRPNPDQIAADAARRRETPFCVMQSTGSAWCVSWC
jgi:hypothetical protein